MWGKIKKIYKMVTDQEGTIFTYAFAYSLIVGLAPLLIITVVFIGNYLLDVTTIINYLQRFIPGEFIEPFIDYVMLTDARSTWILLSLLGASMFVASKSIYSFLLMARKNDDKPRKSIILRITALIYFVVLVFGFGLLGFVISYLPFGKKQLIPVVIFAFFAIFYQLIYSKNLKLSALLWGAGFASVTLLLLGQGFFIYINEYSSYQNVYGPLSSLMILLISMWLVSWIFYAGYCVSVVLNEDTEAER